MLGSARRGNLRTGFEGSWGRCRSSSSWPSSSLSRRWHWCSSSRRRRAAEAKIAASMPMHELTETDIAWRIGLLDDRPIGLSDCFAGAELSELFAGADKESVDPVVEESDTPLLPVLPVAAAAITATPGAHTRSGPIPEVRAEVSRRCPQGRRAAHGRPRRRCRAKTAQGLRANSSPPSRRYRLYRDLRRCCSARSSSFCSSPPSPRHSGRRVSRPTTRSRPRPSRSSSRSRRRGRRRRPADRAAQPRAGVGPGHGTVVLARDRRPPRRPPRRPSPRRSRRRAATPRPTRARHRDPGAAPRRRGPRRSPPPSRPRSPRPSRRQTRRFTLSPSVHPGEGSRSSSPAPRPASSGAIVDVEGAGTSTGSNPPTARSVPTLHTTSTSLSRARGNGLPSSRPSPNVRN